jgi:multiple antibiotic resistance protein
VAITLGAHIRQFEEGRYFVRFPLFIAALSSMAVICIPVWLCYAKATYLTRVLGPTGTTIVTRLSAFILLAIGVQIMWTGFATAIRPLIAHATAP